jgi:CobQ-like glutamine amidotransferase family enzyme
MAMTESSPVTGGPAADQAESGSKGRHAARDLADTTLILPAQRWPDEPEAAPADAPQRRAGRHASRPAEERAVLVPAVIAGGPVPASSTVTGSAGNGPRPAGNGTGPGSGEVSTEVSTGYGAVPGNGAAGAARPGGAAAGEGGRAGVSGPGSPRPSARRRVPAGGRESRLRIVWVYPDLLSTYGDRGNLLVLCRRARLRGIENEAIEINSDQPVPADGDIYLLGGGEDLPQILAANRLRADGGLASAARRGAVVLAVCAGYQVLGHQFGGVEGEPVAGLDILDITSGRGSRRGVGELVADVDPALSVPRITGFENHQGKTTLGPGALPLARVSLGVGNGDGTEGAYAGRVLGTYMHGPALARNPGLADLLLSWAAGPLRPLDPEAEEWAGQLRAERLAAVTQ